MHRLVLFISCIRRCGRMIGPYMRSWHRHRYGRGRRLIITFSIVTT
jgi:hypothetical protein